MKKILIFVILSAAIITGGYFWSQKRANVKTETPRWSTVQVKKGSIRVARATRHYRPGTRTGGHRTR